MTIESRPRILVIDDELSICQNCLKILSKIECEAEYAFFAVGLPLNHGDRDDH